MKVEYYETIFECTETLQNGKERRVKKSVMSPIFRNGRHVIELARIGNGIKALEAEHYYNIEYIKTAKKSIIYTD